MYDNKTEAVRDSFYTTRAISVLLILLAAMFLAYTQESALLRLAIYLDPKDTVASYVDSRDISEYVVESSYRYSVAEKDYVYTIRLKTHRFEDFIKKNGAGDVILLYSGFFPDRAYIKSLMADLKGDTTIFLSALIFSVLLFLLVLFMTVKIYRLENPRYNTGTINT